MRQHLWLMLPNRSSSSSIQVQVIRQWHQQLLLQALMLQVLVLRKQCWLQLLQWAQWQTQAVGWRQVHQMQRMCGLKCRLRSCWDCRYVSGSVVTFGKRKHCNQERQKTEPSRGCQACIMHCGSCCAQQVVSSCH